MPKKQWIYDYFYEFASEALHIFNFLKSMTSCLSELKVSPSFCFPFKIPDEPTATIIYIFRKVPFIHHFIEKVDKFSNTAVTVLISTSLLLGKNICKKIFWFSIVLYVYVIRNCQICQKLTFKECLKLRNSKFQRRFVSCQVISSSQLALRVKEASHT